MADVRSLLKNERAARRIDHPQASYSSTGTLECSVCKIPLKSDMDVWNKHLKSSQHAMRAERLRISQTQAPSKNAQDTAGNTTTTSAIKGPTHGSKKRKADDDNGEEDARKRTRPETVDPVKSASSRKLSFDEPSQTAATPPAKHANLARPSPTQVTAPPPPAASSEAVDENEWAAFEASLARRASPSPPPSAAPTAALTAAATITAAPLTAAELAARSREEASLQSKERREAELEGEKEDAARQLEEEFDEMEGLEERVRRLKEQREALRMRRANETGEGKVLETDSRVKSSETAVASFNESDDDEDEGDEQDFDNWGAWGHG